MAPEQRTQKKRVLIFYTGNSATSQMAEGLLRHDAGEYFEVESAGTRPGRCAQKRSPFCVRWELISVGIDLSTSMRLVEFNSTSSSRLMATLVSPVRYSSGMGKNCTAISKTQRRSLARRNNGSICFGGSATNYVVISESLLWL